MAVATVLFLAANPAATSRLALDEEARGIEQELRMAPHRDAFAVRALWAPRPLDLLRGLNEARPAIVHFAGHGVADQGIVLPDGGGGEVVVTGEALRRLFEEFPQTVRLVVLNACFSQEQCDDIKEAIGCAIGMNAAMGDVAARRFAEALYSALGAGCSIKAAFDQAVALLHIYAGAQGEDGRRDVAPEQESARAGGYATVPVLCCRAEVDPDRISFAAGAAAAVSAPAAEPDGSAVVRAARRALNGLDDRERELAIQTLAGMDDPDARAALVEALAHPVKSVRTVAARRFPDRSDPRILRPLVDGIADIWRPGHWPADEMRELYIACRAAGAAAVPVLVAILDGPAKLPEDLRAKIVEIIGASDSPDVVPALVRFLGRGQSGLTYAVDALARLGVTSAAPQVRPLLQHEWDSVRAAAARCLGILGDRASAPVLADLLGRETKSVRQAATRALALLRDPATVPQLTQALADPDRRVQIGAARALIALGEPAGTEHLRSLLWAQPETRVEINDDDVEIMTALLPQQDPKVLATVERRLESYRSGSRPGEVLDALVASGPDGLAAALRLIDRHDLSSSVTDEAANALGKLDLPEAAAAVRRWRLRK